MTIGYVSVPFAMLLLGVALWTGCLLVFNPVLRSIRITGIVSAYAIMGWMLLALPWRVAVVTWCLFAVFGGIVALAYELWARRRYAGTGRADRPLVLLRGFLLWPSMIPAAVEGAMIDAGILDRSAS